MIRRPNTGGFGAFVRKLRLARGLTQNALAAAVGCHANYIYKLETGRRQVPQGLVLIRLAPALDVPLSHLLVIGGLVEECERPEIFDGALHQIDRWRSNVRLKESARALYELIELLVRNRDAVRPDFLHVLVSAQAQAAVVHHELQVNR